MLVLSFLSPCLSPFTIGLEYAGIAAVPIPLFLAAAGLKLFLSEGLFLEMTPWLRQSGLAAMAVPRFSSEVQPAGTGSATPALPTAREALLTPQASAGEHQEGK